MTRTRPRVRAVLLASALALAGTVAVGQPAGAVDGVFVGACTIELDVTYSPALVAIPGAPNISVGGGPGTCVMDGMIGTVNLGGGMTGNQLGCAEGAALGSLAMTFEIGNWTGSFPAATVALTNIGGVMEFAFTQNLHKFAGAGVAVPEPVAAANCAVSGVTTTTWTVAFAFEDPETPVAR